MPHHTTPHHTNVLCILSWYSSYNLHGTKSGGEHFFAEHMRSVQQYCNVAAYVPFEAECPQKFNDEEEWGIRTFRYRFTKWYLWLKNSIIFKILKKLHIIEIYEIIHFVRGFKKLYKSFKPDVIHAQALGYAGLFAAFFLRAYNIPLVITEHQLIRAKFKLIRFILRMAYKLSQKNICVSDGQREHFRKIFPDIDFTVIYNGIYDIPIDSSVKKYRREGFINCVIVAGFYSKTIKGFQFLLPAMRILVHDLNIPLMLHICGGGGYFEYFKNVANELQIADNCIFYGQCTKKQVYSVVSEMDFGISASILESAGINVEEMMLLGKPLVVTKSCGANSLVTDFSAIIVDKGSIEALVEGIHEMSERYMEFNGKAIRDYARANFMIEDTARKYAQIYRELTDEHEKSLVH